MTPVLSPYCSYQLSQKELIEGRILSPVQLARMQNLLATYADDILALRFDPQKPQEYIQADAELKGKLVLLQFLVADSADAQQEYANLSQ